MSFSIKATIRALLAPEHRITCNARRWRQIIRELERRGRRRHEAAWDSRDKYRAAGRYNKARALCPFRWSKLAWSRVSKKESTFNVGYVIVALSTPHNHLCWFGPASNRVSIE
jgi:hypothetical protein